MNTVDPLFLILTKLQSLMLTSCYQYVKVLLLFHSYNLRCEENDKI